MQAMEFSYKYKIVEEVMSDGTKRFKAQSSWRASQFVGSWREIYGHDNQSSLEEAQAVIDKHIQEEKDRIKVVETIEHVYPPEIK
jgi:ribosomal protein L32E